MSNHNSCGLCSIEMKNISVTSGEDILLDNINLTFHCGELTALIGKNGAGKTTLLRTLLGERHYKGSISFTDHHGVVLPMPRIGYVPQHLDFDKSMPISVSDFIAAAKGGSPVWLGKQKKMQAHIREILEDMECGYLAERRLGALSGGELQRVLLALATDPVPDLLVLDEPVSGVDMAGLDLFYKRVTELRDKQHMAILLVSHDLGLIRKYADRVVLLDKTVVAQGDANKVFATDAFREAFGFSFEDKSFIVKPPISISSVTKQSGTSHAGSFMRFLSSPDFIFLPIARSFVICPIRLASIFPCILTSSSATTALLWTFSTCSLFMADNEFLNVFSSLLPKAPIIPVSLSPLLSPFSISGW